MDVNWMLSKEQIVNILPKIKSTLKWMDALHKAPSYDFDVRLEYRSSSKEWWLFINGSGCGATFTIKKSHKQWKQI